MKPCFDSLVFLVTFAITLEDVALSLTCHDCSRIPHPADCGHVMECEANSACSVQEIITDSGVTLFNVGCRSLQRCGAHKKRNYADDIQEDNGDLIVCDDCCQGDFCNNKGCGSNLLPNLIDRGPICFNCPDFETFCDNVIECQSNEVCFLSPVQTVTGTQLRAGCRPSQVCDKLGTLTADLGRRDVHTCTGCCRTDYCNRDCTTVQTIFHIQTPPPAGSTFLTTHTTTKAPFQTGPNLLTTIPPDNTPCMDTIDNCADYAQDVCTRAEYKNWVRGHCRVHCKLCTPGPNLLTTIPPDNTPCVDTIDNCADYAQDVCTRAEFKDWVRGHCRVHCKLCTPTTTTTTTTTSTLCINTIPNCYEYNSNVCTDATYQAWVHAKCRKYCGKC